MKQAWRKRGGVSYREIRAAFGNGNELWGKVLLEEIAKRLVFARAKHPVFAEAQDKAVDVVGEEWAELSKAVEDNEGPLRVYDESLDVIATAVRMANREWEWR